jgi:Amt family ammonium transporter
VIAASQFCVLVADGDPEIQASCASALTAANVARVASGEAANLAFVLIGSFMVLFMQVGYAFYELGSVRAKNAKSVLFKVVFCTGFIPLVFWLWGTAIAGDSVTYGEFRPDLEKWNEPIYFVHSTAIALVTGSLLSGAVTERMTFEGFVVVLAFISSLVFPLVLFFIWGSNGFLHNMGFVDYGGGAAVHLCGGTGALVACMTLGPRCHRFSKNPQGELVVHNMAAHSPIFTGIGTLIMFISWLAVMATAALAEAAAEPSVQIAAAGDAVANTLICVCVSVTLSIVHHSRKYGVQSAEVMNSCILSALVAITPCAAYIHGWTAAILGILSFCVCNLEPFCYMLLMLEIDDPCDVINIHVFQNVLGLLFTGIFADPKKMDVIRYPEKLSGLIYSGNFELLGVQLLGVLVVFFFTFASVSLCCFIYHKVRGPLRVPKHDELLGLDVRYYDGYAYPDLTKHMLRLDKDVKEAEKKVKHMKVKSNSELVLKKQPNKDGDNLSDSSSSSTKKDADGEPESDDFDQHPDEEEITQSSRFRAASTSKSVRKKSFSGISEIMVGGKESFASLIGQAPDSGGNKWEQMSPIHAGMTKTTVASSSAASVDHDVL